MAWRALDALLSLLETLGDEQSCSMPADQPSNVWKQPDCCSGPLNSGEGNPACRLPKQVAGALAQDQYPVEKGTGKANKEDGDTN